MFFSLLVSNKRQEANSLEIPTEVFINGLDSVHLQRTEISGTGKKFMIASLYVCHNFAKFVITERRFDEILPPGNGKRIKTKQIVVRQ